MPNDRTSGTLRRRSLLQRAASTGLVLFGLSGVGGATSEGPRAGDRATGDAVASRARSGTSSLRRRPTPPPYLVRTPTKYQSAYWQTISFDSRIRDEPVAVASMQTMNGNDTAWPGVRAVGDGILEIHIEEENSQDFERQHTREQLGLLALESGPIRTPDGTQIGEAGVQTLEATGQDDEHRVPYDGSYDRDLVVFAQVQTQNGSDPVHSRVTHPYSGDAFALRIEEWPYEDGGHTAEEVGYIALEKGAHRLRNGLELDVGATTTNPLGTEVQYRRPVHEPTVLTQCQSESSESIVARQETESDSFAVFTQYQESDYWEILSSNTVGHVAIGLSHTLEAGTMADSLVTRDTSTLNYRQRYRYSPVPIASVTTWNDPEAVDVRFRSSGSRAAIVEKEQPDGRETLAAADTCAYVAAYPGRVTDDDGQVAGEAAVESFEQPDRSSWTHVQFGTDYGSIRPVVLAQVRTKNGGSPVHARLRNVTSDGFDVKLEEWPSTDGRHYEEEVGWMALKPGVWGLPGGSWLQVGRVGNVDHTGTTWNAIDDRLYSGTPGEVAVVSRAQTFHGQHPIVTRHENVTPSSFRVALQEEGGTPHTTETVGYAMVVHDA